MAFARSPSGAHTFLEAGFPRRSCTESQTFRPFPRRLSRLMPARLRPAALAAALAAAMGFTGCTNTLNSVDLSATAPSAPAASGNPTMGSGDFKVGLVLPLSASGNAGAVGQGLRNAAEMALAEVNFPGIQLLPKDDAGTAQGAQAAVQQAIDEGAQVILGPLFAHSVTNAKPVARNRGVPMIAFSTDSNVAAPGAYLLSFLPESEVDRVVSYAVSQGKHSFIGLVPSTGYGSVAESEFKQAAARRGARIVAIEHYGDDRNKIGDVARVIAQSASQADALFIPDSGDGVTDAVAALSAAGVNVRQLALMGTQLWDDPKIFANQQLEGGWYPAPDPANPNGYKAFAERYRSRYRQEPPRVATQVYDAVTLIAALVRSQGPSAKITNEVLTNPSGFAGLDGVFRFRNDGTNQRGLAVLKVTPAGGQPVAPATRTFPASAT
jgi:ABC-type branched-subunit amino acid transport system substrate-binding protein